MKAIISHNEITGSLSDDILLGASSDSIVEENQISEST